MPAGGSSFGVDTSPRIPKQQHLQKTGQSSAANFSPTSHASQQDWGPLSAQLNCDYDTLAPAIGHLMTPVASHVTSATIPYACTTLVEASPSLRDTGHRQQRRSPQRTVAIAIGARAVDGVHPGKPTASSVPSSPFLMQRRALNRSSSSGIGKAS